MKLRIVSHLLNPVSIDPIAQAIAVPGEDRVVVLCELINNTDQVVTGATIIGVGYADEGPIVALAETGPWCLFPHQIRPVQINLVPLKDTIRAVRLFPFTDVIGR